MGIALAPEIRTFTTIHTMSEKKPLNIGLVGYGFMGRTHSNGYKRVNDFFPDVEYRPVLKAICARNEERANEFASQWGFESVETDWQALIARDDIDAIDICTPNDTHASIAIAAAEAGKMVLCEKPLARTTEESLPMVEAVEKAGVANTVWYNYRRVPAVTLAKQIIESGKLGKIFHDRANFLQDWTISEELPQGGEGLWRLDAAAAGSGVTGDLLAHCIDTAIWLMRSLQSRGTEDLRLIFMPLTIELNRPLIKFDLWFPILLQPKWPTLPEDARL